MAKTFKRFFKFTFLLLIMGAFIALLMKLQSNNLSGAFELEASEQWIIRQVRPGEIVARHTQGRREAVQGVKIYSYPDDDIVTVDLLSNLVEGTYVRSGTPVLEISSISDQSKEKLLEARVKRLEEQLKLHFDGEFQAKQKEEL